jgi:hypothetical protein
VKPEPTAHAGPQTPRHVLLDTGAITGWRKARKTKGVRAKPLQSILTDPLVLPKLFLETLEGRQGLKAGSVCCVGSRGEAWQQTPKKLLQQYEVVDLTEDGWLVCEPRPDAGRDAYEVPTEVCGPDGLFSIVAPWGEQALVDGRPVYLQHGRAGDVVCRNPTDRQDVWVVQARVFAATQEFLEPPPAQGGRRRGRKETGAKPSGGRARPRQG